MDPTSDSPNDSQDARRPPASGPSAARTARTVAVYLAHRLWQGAIYLGATALDLIDAARLALLTRSRAKLPDRVGDFDAQMARLREERSRRWSSWETLPGGRRMEIRFAAAVLFVAAILGLRAYLAPTRGSSKPVAHQPTPAHAPSVASHNGIAATPSATAAVDQALLDAEHFMEYRKQAAPGQWIVYGVEPVEPARAKLAEMEVQLTTARVAGRAAFDKFEKSNAEADRAAKAKVDDRIQALQSARNAAAAAVERAMHPVVRPVLTRGDVPHWDDFKVMSPVVIKEGSRYRMWYTGCHFVRDEYTCGIGHAQSRDGMVWEKSPDPVLTIEDPLVSQDLHSIAVVRAGDEYLMWYSIDHNLLHGNDCATLNLAASRDGLAWKPQGVALSTNCQPDAHLWQGAFSDGKTIHLWYTDFDSSAKGSLMHLVSSDGKKWQKAGSTDIGTLGMTPRRLWIMPDHSAGYRALFAAHDRSEDFGMLQSPDGNSWNVAGAAWKLVEFDLFHGDDPEAPVAIVESGGTWMWFAVPNTKDGSEAIALAFRKEAQP